MATNSRCRLCHSVLASESFYGTILRRHRVAFFSCYTCGLFQTEAPYWLAEAYTSAITNADTGIMQRNIMLARITATLIDILFNSRGRFIDFAGGYGIFVRLMRDRGFDFYWHDLHAPNLLARGFEASSLNEQRVELVTSFESFEHFVEPMAELDNIFRLSDSVLFSTLLVADPAPPIDQWWYYGTEHGQHISFYRRRTLEYIAQHRRLHLCTNERNLHFLSKRRIPDWLFNACSVAGYLGLSSIMRPFRRSLTILDAAGPHKESL